MISARSLIDPSIVPDRLTTQLAQMATNGNTTKLLSPTELCHVVLKTTPENLQKMVSFYTTFLGAKVVSSNERISFLVRLKSSATMDQAVMTSC